MRQDEYMFTFIDLCVFRDENKYYGIGTCSIHLSTIHGFWFIIDEIGNKIITRAISFQRYYLIYVALYDFLYILFTLAGLYIS